MGKRKEIDTPALIKPECTERLLRSKRRRSADDAEEDSVAQTLLFLRTGRRKDQPSSGDGVRERDTLKAHLKHIPIAMAIRSSISHVTDDEEELPPALSSSRPAVTRRSPPAGVPGVKPLGPPLAACLPMPPPLAVAPMLLKRKQQQQPRVWGGFAPRRLPVGRPLPMAPRLPNYILKKPSKYATKK